MIISYLVPVVLVVMLIAASIRILPEYKRGVVFFLGRYQTVKGPGLVIVRHPEDGGGGSARHYHGCAGTGRNLSG